MIGPDRAAFTADPIGYSGLAWHKWQTALLFAGMIERPSEEPTREDLKSPILWLSQANALSEAAKVLVQFEPTWESMPLSIRGMCDCQYSAVALMLVGYSLETCLKAMHILRHGAEEFIAREKDYFHHDLVELAEFLPQVTDKERATLKALTHFTTWAGRYPDPGSRRIDHAEEVFALSESHQISGHDLFALAARVMKHVQTFTAE
ncbi:hypothetical protein [Synechococcus sp. CCY 0621]|uniref:hypothetical protein n=1 Tax=Synechococcus sp. CCY 0621 TaxID=2815603 RepID=UPI001C21E7D4|nr:hypothetical protein [Synechococcus sp. CCY 0621]